MKMNKPKKKGMEKAMITALISKKKSLSLKRLLHDYEEIKNQILPIPGVTAAPIDENFYEWHGNIKSMTDNIYKNTVIHFKLLFPHDYPLSPPKIEVLSSYPNNPNMRSCSSEICIDFLEKKSDVFSSPAPKQVPEGGWNCGYSVLSILSQLQVYFFDIYVNPSIFTKLYDNERKNIKEKIKVINSYHCQTCLHKGIESPFPPFPINPKNEPTPEEFMQIKKKELCGYLRKISYQESPLGIGINISKIPRTGEIKSITPCFDFISLKTFSKQRLRIGLKGERFTHWFPLYFGEKKEIFLKSVTKALSMIVNGNTKEFRPDLFMKVMPKFFNALCLNLIEEKMKNSSKSIEILLYIYRIMIMFVQEFPEIKKECNERIEKFIQDPEERIKKNTPSLGDLLVMLTISDHKIEEILPSYISEQMDRQIFWILIEIPEFEKLINLDEVDDIRAKICFKCGLIGQQLLLLYYSFMNKLVLTKCKTCEEFGEKMDKFFGNLQDNEFYGFIKEINKILKIDNYTDSYKYLGINPPDKKELNEKLKQSFKNSLSKNYHGEDKVRFVPPPADQVKYYMERFKPIKDFTQDGKLLPADDPKWKEELNNFDIVSQYKYTFPNQEMTPLSLIRFLRKKMSDKIFKNSPNEENDSDFDRITNQLIKNKHKEKVDEDEEIIKSLTWRQLYIKLYFEEFARFFPYIADFNKLYRTLELVRDEIVHFSLYISTVGILKSDFNYIRGIFSFLTSIKYLELIFTKEISSCLLKNLIKGINNGIKEKCAIEHLKIIVNPVAIQYSSKELNLLSIIDNLSYLKILDLNGVKLNMDKVLRIKNHLYFYKKIKILDLGNCHLNDNLGAELADGLMKNKNIEKVYINSNNFRTGLANIIYNLSFQPLIKYIDISDNDSCNKNKVAINLQKLIKISPSIETIIAREMKGLNSNLKDDFFYALGENSNLKTLILSCSGNFNNISQLGKAISFNALKGGSLSFLDLENCNISFDNLTRFIENLSICEEDHTKWYGFQFNNEINKDSPEFFEKKFNCKLETLLLAGNNLICDFYYLDAKNVGTENPIKKLISGSKNLESLFLNGCKTNKYFIDSLADALRSENNLKYLSLRGTSIDTEKMKSLAAAFYAPIPEKSIKEKNEIKNEIKQNNEKEIINRLPNPHFHIEELDLSGNSLGYSGFETLSNVLKINQTLKKLNLFHNCGDVNSGRRISEALKINTTLVELDIGHNRIKNEGIKNIFQAIKENKKSGIRYLGTRYNLIRKETFSNIMKIIEEDENIKIEEIDCKYNELPSGFLTKYYNDVFSKMNKKIQINVFDVLYFLQPERLERTVWIPIKAKDTSFIIAEEIKTCEKKCIEEKKSHIGIPLYIRMTRGKKTGKKRDNKGLSAFVEFMMPNSANRMLQIGTTGGFKLSTRKGKVFKAGTRSDYFVVKKFEFK